MIAKETLAKARAAQHMDDILDAQFMGINNTAVTATNKSFSSDKMYLSLKLHKNIEDTYDSTIDMHAYSSYPSMIPEMTSLTSSNSFMFHDTDCLGPAVSGDEQYNPQGKRRRVEESDQESSHHDHSTAAGNARTSEDHNIKQLKQGSQECTIEFDVEDDEQRQYQEPTFEFDLEDNENDSNDRHQEQDGPYYENGSMTSTVPKQTSTKLNKSVWGEEDVPIGFTFHKYFPKFGWFQGTVIQIRVGAKDNKTRRVSYCDGDSEDLSITEIQKSVHNYMEFCSNKIEKEDEAYAKHLEKLNPPRKSTDGISAGSEDEESKVTATASTRSESNKSITSAAPNKSSSSAESRKRDKQLDALGFKWEIKEPFMKETFKVKTRALKVFREKRKRDLFDERLDMLRDYKKIHGHPNVPTNHKNQTLSKWCLNVRRAYKQWKAGERNYYGVDDERIKQLEALGFKWEIKAPLIIENFEEKFKALREFREKHGHVKVPTKPHRYPENTSLVFWCKYIRAMYKLWLKGERNTRVLTDERIKRLEELGFEWNLKAKKKEDSFRHKFQELMDFKEKYGHTEVPQSNPDLRSLSKWCTKVRAEYRDWTANKSSLPGPLGLTEEYAQRLHEIGFRFEIPVKKTFEEWLEEFRDYKDKYGNTDLTENNNKKKEYQSLANWCTAIRYGYTLLKHNKPGKRRGLNEERIKILEEMGFKFKLRKFKGK